MTLAPTSTPSPTETREQLRRLIRAIEARPSAVPAAPRPLAVLRRDTPVYDLATLGLEPRATPVGVCMVREVRTPVRYAEAAARDDDAFDFDDLARASASALALLAPDADLEDVGLEELLFLDIETTGLGGAGVMTFLVATGRVEADAQGQGEFVLRQYLAPSPPDEAALLHALIEDGGVRDHDPVLVTYNGRAFDAPALDERATMHRQRAGFDALRHLDLLMPVRTAYRGLLPSCRLGEIEHAVLGMTRPSYEVGGAETPAWYFRYLRTQDARILAPLLDHNARDVLALASLTGRLAAVVEGTRAVEGVHALAAGRLLAARGREPEARTHLERVATATHFSPQREEARLRLAVLHKAAGRRDLAEPLWLAAAAQPGAAALRPLTELAIYYERHLRDHARALEVVERALGIVEGMARVDAALAGRWRDRLLHRHRRVHSRADRTAHPR